MKSISTSEQTPSTTSNPEKSSAAPKRKAYPLTDAGNGEHFAELYGHQVRFDHSRNKWYIWNGHRWELDSTQRIRQFAKQAARTRLSSAQGAAIHLDPASDAGLEETKRLTKECSWSRTSESTAKIDATLKAAASERKLADDGKNWNLDPMLLGVKNGVVDLKTGKYRPGTPEDRITLSSSVIFDPNARCPRWEQFVREVCDSSLELAEFLQRAIGYTITGLTEEQAIFMLTGGGANGKSTFIDAIRYVFGEYAYNLPFSAFEMRGRSEATNDIAALKDKRFVTALETNESAELNEARIKMLSGQDEVTARYLFAEYISFKPVCKLWFSFNHKPSVSDDSDGFWRRILVINFPRQFQPHERDSRLIEKLRAEAPGILNWAIEGCRKWQESGLRVPQSVRTNSQLYREQSDTISGFIEDCCECHASASVTVAELSRAYAEWSQANAVKPLSRQAFNRQMEAHGFRQDRAPKASDRTRIWRGLRLKLSAPADQPSAKVTNVTSSTDLLVM
jgi:putative DNA primase/helicase